MKINMKNGAVCVTILALMSTLLMGCSTNPQDAKQDISQNVTEETQQAAEVVEATESPVQETQRYEDNFAVDSEAAKAFAERVQAVTVKKDLEGLADLTVFPVYVGLPGAGAVKTREDFLSLGAEAVFTEELLKSVEMANIDNFHPSKAGFSISDGGTSNINFGVVNGVLAITGINYGYRP